MYTRKADISEIMGVGYVVATDSLKKLSDYEDEITDYLKPKHNRFSFQTTSSSYVTALTITGSGVLMFLLFHPKVVGISSKITIDGIIYELYATSDQINFLNYIHSEEALNAHWMEFKALLSIVKEYPVISLKFKTSLLVEIKSDGTNTAKLKGIYSHGI